MSHTRPRTLFDKLWERHLVRPETEEAPAVLYVDLHLVHEVTSPQAFDVLARGGLAVRRPGRTLATVDHSVPTAPGSWRGGLVDLAEAPRRQLGALAANCARHGIELLGVNDARRGIVHVIGPELGATRPGMTVVCGDSHTTTHGAFGALAFGIGTTEVAHVLATQCLLQRRPRTMVVDLTGRLRAGVTAKDAVLALIGGPGGIGVGGAAGHVIEFRGEAVSAMGMEARMTLCNMAIEAGARAGMIAPDDVTFEYLAGRPLAPAGEAWERALSGWRRLPGDEGAAHDAGRSLDVSRLEPQVTWGTDPGMVMPLGGRVPDDAPRRVLEYMGLSPGQPLAGLPVDLVFVGSCTNSRLSDLREAAGLLRGRKVAPGVRMVVVPGSQRIKREAEAEGLDRVFTDAGAEWHESGCSLCIAMNGDRAGPRQRVVSTSNRNFEGRQGTGARTHLASPLTAAAAAVAGAIADPGSLPYRQRRIA